jgi:hypothetical protein
MLGALAIAKIDGATDASPTRSALPRKIQLGWQPHDVAPTGASHIDHDRSTGTFCWP